MCANLCWKIATLSAPLLQQPLAARGSRQDDSSCAESDRNLRTTNDKTPGSKKPVAAAFALRAKAGACSSGGSVFKWTLWLTLLLPC